MEQEYQEIDLIEVFWVVLRKWWLIILLMVIAGGAAYYVTDTYITPVYKAESTLFIGKESDILSNISLSDVSLDNKLVLDYRELIKTRLVTEEVIEELSLITTTKGLIENLSIDVIADSRFMHISYEDPIPERATQIVNSLSDVLANRAMDIVGVDNVKIVDYAIVPVEPISPSKMKNVAIAAVLGAMVALGIIFLQMLMDNTVKTEEDVEKILGLSVLGVIPEFKGEVRKR